MLHKNKNFNEIMKKALEISDRWVIAISGGADSLGLFFVIMDFLSEIHQKVELYLLTVNHNLRAEVVKEIEYINEIACFYGVKFDKLEWNHNNIFDGNIYNDGRKARYNLMTQRCNEIGSKVLFTAHHLDDQIETFEMRVARGAGVSGLSCIKQHVRYKNINILRPFLEIKRKDIKNYLSKKNILWIEERTNYNSDYERAKIRRNQLNQRFDENYGVNVNLISKKMYLANEALDFYLNIEFNSIVFFDKNAISIDKSRFFEIPIEIAVRILKKIMIENFLIEERRIYFENILILYESMKKKLFEENTTLRFSNFVVECMKDCFYFRAIKK